MTGRSLKDIQEDRLQKRKGLTSRGIVGCFTLLVSTGAAYWVYYFLSDRYPLRRLFGIPRDKVPDLFMDILGVLVLLILIQALLTIITSLVWKLAGKDRKVKDMMDDLYEQWDDVQY